MFLTTSAKRLSVACLLLLTSCKGGHGKPVRDSATDPVTSDGGAPCSAEHAGQGCGVEVRGEFNHCPHVSFDISPTQAQLELGAKVVSMSVDPEGDGLSYAWTSEPDGHFDDPGSMATQYRCESIGRKTIRLTVLDARGCDSEDAVEIACVNVRDFLRSGVKQIPTP